MPNLLVTSAPYLGLRAIRTRLYKEKTMQVILKLNFIIDIAAIEWSW